MLEQTNKFKMQRRIVIWGDDHHNALGLLRMLGGRGFDILFMVHRVNNRIATTSKYCTSFIIVNGLEEGIEYLAHNYQDKENKAVLLFTADKFSEIANRNLQRLKDFFYVAGPMHEGLLVDIDDKYTMAKLASECGIALPKTILFSHDSIETIEEFPVIIKPCSPAFKDFKTKIIKSKKQLNKEVSHLLRDKRYIIQPFIRKEADGLIYGCRTWDGITYLAGICVRNRWGDDGCGSFGYLTPEIPECISVSSIDRFLQKIDFRGLFSVEYALTVDNAYFYEFNLRNDGTSVLFYNAGSNIALSFVNSCFGISGDVPIKVNGKQYLMHEILDRFNVFDGVITRKQWLEDKKRVTLHFFYDPDDMKPYEILMSQEKKKIIHHIVSRSCLNQLRLKFKNHIQKRNRG